VSESVEVFIPQQQIREYWEKQHTRDHYALDIPEPVVVEEEERECLIEQK